MLLQSQGHSVKLQVHVVLLIHCSESITTRTYYCDSIVNSSYTWPLIYLWSISIHSSGAVMTQCFLLERTSSVRVIQHYPHTMLSFARPHGGNIQQTSPGNPTTIVCYLWKVYVQLTDSSVELAANMRSRLPSKLVPLPSRTNSSFQSLC